MAERKDLKETIEIPEGVTFTINKDFLATAKGPAGEVSKKLEARGISIKVEGNSVVLEANNAKKLQKNLLFTFKAHLRNIIKGAHEGFTYKLKICSGHFPMSVSLKNGVFEIKNFIGEKVPRTLVIKEGADVQINGDIIEVKGNSIETTGQVAADIEKLTRRPGFDRRIFQDGIYITEKAGKAV
jgi:large subunit ribosomal protein L6